MRPRPAKREEHTKMAAPQLMTVRGAVDCAVDAVQWVLPHEHVFHSINANLTTGPAASPLSAESSTAGANHDLTDIRPDQLHELRVDPTLLNGRNLTLEREDEVYREIEALSSTMSCAGIIVDTTTPREGRDLLKLRRVAERVGVHIVASTSFDITELTIFPAARSAQEKSERIAKIMETELMFGAGATQADGCAGIIYQQVHFEHPGQSETQEILLKALALAQSSTSAPLYLSFSRENSQFSSENAFLSEVSAWVTALVAFGALAERVVLCHADSWSESASGMQFLVELARRGVALSFDLVGVYAVSDVLVINPCLASLESDAEPPRVSSIARCLASLINDYDLCDRILVSSGVLQRIQLRRYGGGGYAYALHAFKQRLMQRHGVSAAQWSRITRENPLKLLLWYSPPAAVEIPKHFLKCSICANYFEPIVGEYFTKFQFVYCDTKCLRKHSKLGFKPLE